ncbi:MAG: hypothetical protein ABF990_07560 [Acetobacter sp.]
MASMLRCASCTCSTCAVACEVVSLRFALDMVRRELSADSLAKLLVYFDALHDTHKIPFCDTRAILRGITIPDFVPHMACLE